MAPYGVGPEPTTPASATLPNVTAPSLTQMKARGDRIVMCTAYDYSGARLADLAGVDSILVGDSLGMTVLGHGSTIPVSLEDMIAATAAVTRATTRPLIVADLPFMTYHVSYERGMEAAARLVQEGGAEAVKLEGATELTLRLVRGLTEAGIPVIGHLGLTPQSVNALGGYRVQGREASGAAHLVSQAHALAEAGVAACVLECIPDALAAHITAMCTMPTIGIGAGPSCDGEVQVFHDLLGLSSFTPRHARRYLDGDRLMVAALTEYVADVRAGAFPGAEQSTPMDPAVLATALSALEAAGLSAPAAADRAATEATPPAPDCGGAPC